MTSVCEGEQEDEAATYKKLLASRLLILDELQTVRTTLLDNRAPPDSFNEVYYPTQKSGTITIFFDENGRLTELGKNKVAQIFRKFDNDEDGALNYSEFRAYLNALHRINQIDTSRAIRNLDYQEGWQMYIHDTYDVDESGNMTLKGFFKYREETKDLFSLREDLIALGLTWLHSELEKAVEAKKIFELYDKHNEGFIPVDDLQALLFECGEVHTKQHLAFHLKLQRARFQCMQRIRQLNKTMRLFGCYQESKIVVEEEDRLYKDAFLSWFSARRESQTLGMWERYCLLTKLKTFTWIRRGLDSIKTHLQWIRKAVEFNMLEEHNLVMANHHESEGHLTTLTTIGELDQCRSELQLVYTTEADASTALHDLEYGDAEAKGFIFVDFILTPEMKEADAQEAAASLKFILDTYFRKHLVLLEHLHSWFVKLLIKKSLLRIAFLFTEKVDPYIVLKDLGLPAALRTEKLLSRFQIRLRFSLSLFDLLDNARMFLNQHLACKISVIAEYDRLSWAEIIEQATYQFLDSVREQIFDRKVIDEELKQAGGTLPTREEQVWENVAEEIRVSRLEEWAKMYLKLAKWLRFSEYYSAAFHFESFFDLINQNAFMVQVLPVKLRSMLNDYLTNTGSVTKSWRKAMSCLKQELEQLHIQSLVNPEGEENQLYHAYVSLRSSIVGLNTVHSEFDTTGLEFTCEGFEFADLFPELKK